MNPNSLYHSEICEENYDLYYNPDELYETAHGVDSDDDYARGSESYEQMATRHYA